MNISENTRLIKAEAQRLGFDFCGISKSEFLEEEAPRLEEWLKKKMNGEMKYMENHFEKRLNPGLLVEGAKSVISLLLNYFPGKRQLYKDVPKISKYAYGLDYHSVIKDKLKNILEFIREKMGDVNGRVFVDSAPVMDKVWAKKSGLGWVGKNTNLINKNSGSFFFIAELILDIELEYDVPVKDYCGTCTACIDACPTEAIVEPYLVDGSKCISYFTIELKNSIPLEMKGKFSEPGNGEPGWAFGCDICQDVCPWNRFSKPHKEPLFNPQPGFLEMNKNDWQDITEEVFGQLFRNTALNRAGFKGLKRNIDFIK